MPLTEIGVDLTNCNREPIHIPGQIQSHGFLIVVDKSYIIRYHSANTTTLFPGMNHLLGKPLSSIELLLGEPYQPHAITQLLNLGKINHSFEQGNPFQTTISDILYNLIISTAGDDYYLLELEPAVTHTDLQKVIGRFISEILTDKQLLRMLDNTTTQVKKFIGYDRVMVYRFAEDGHGEVLAEAKNENLESWIGLHYPATDIPKQARELYKQNLTRLIADVETIPSKIITHPGSHPQLDLTNAQLRAVSPIHIQYLKNMGVASSFSISLIYKNELWGLIACHHYTPKFIDYKTRDSCKLIGQILSSALEHRQDDESQKVNETFKDNVEKLAKYLQKSSCVEDALTKESVTLLDVVHATGAVLIYEKNITKLGYTPDDEQLKGLLNWVQENVRASVYYTANLSAVYPEAAAYKKGVSGMLVSILSKELAEYIIWFKPEFIQTVHWAGNPEKAVIVNESGPGQISPRNSFAVWLQTVTDTSQKWTSEELKSVLRLKEEVMYAIHVKAGAIRLLNEKLRYAYEELDTFSFTISHDLKNPITVIKSYAEVLTTDASIGQKGQEILQKIVNRSDRMNFMINEVLDYSRIGRSDIQYRHINMPSLINDIVKELEHVYDTRHLELAIGNLPDLQGDPVMISQLFSNLISNAVKYSQQEQPSVVQIGGEVSNGEICYRIKDNGIGIEVKDLPHVFELFNRMENAKHMEGSGVGLAIVKRIVEKHNGKIWAESEPGEGSVFYVSFKQIVTKDAPETIVLIEEKSHWQIG